MGLRTTLFGYAWQSRDPSARAEAVAHMQDQLLIRELPKIAETDADANVRRAALQRITDIPTLNNCRIQDDDSGNRQFATERLTQILCQISSDKGIQQAEPIAAALLSDNLSAALIELLATNAQHRNLRRQALQKIKRSGFLGDRVMQESDPELQQQALEQIDKTSTLERIAKTLRKTDKKLYRLVQQKLEALQPDKHGQSLDDERALQLCQQLETLAKGHQQQTSGATDLHAGLEEIKQAWNKLSDIDEAVRQRFSNTRAILKKALSGTYSSEVPPTDIDPVEPEPVIETQADHSLQHLAVALEEMLLSSPKPATIENWRQTWRAAWRKLNQASAADQRLQEKLRNRLLQYEQQQAETAEQRAAKRAALDDRITVISQAAEDGQLELATGKLQALRKDLPEKPHRKVMERLHGIDQQLGELRRWQRWSDNEQRVRLIKTVEKALKDELNPDALLTLVRDVRTTWEQLEQQEVTHGMRPLPKDHSLARQFNGVCGRAMGQARPYLDNRRKVQQERNALINTLLENTREMLSQTSVDARELLKHKRILGKLFRELSGLPHKKRKQIASEIRQLLDQISEHLSASFSDAESSKRKLIRQAEQLQHLSDRQEAIQLAKQLQRQWKQAGPTSRKVDQQLWEAFRAPLDPLFEHQQQKRAEQQAERDQQHSEQLQLCEQLEALADLEDTQLQANAGKVEGLQEQWPDQEIFDKKLQQRFRAAGEKFTHRLNQWHADQRSNRQQALAEQADQRQQALNLLIESGLDALDAAAQQQLEPLLALSAEQLTEQLAEQDSNARAMCITAEFLSGLPSPAEDRDARMQYQVARLAERMSQRDAQQELSAELIELERQWYANYPLSPDNHSHLHSRFHKALTAAQKLSGA